MTDHAALVARLIEEHARRAVLPVERQQAAVVEAAEANALHNMRYILTRFAQSLAALSSGPATKE